MTPIAAVGVWAGPSLAEHLPARGAHCGVGVVLVALGTLLLARRTPTILTHATTAGAASGFCGGLAGVGGPPALFFLAQRGGCPRTSLATMQAHSALICLTLTTLQGLPNLPASAGLSLAAGTIAGVVAGERVSRSIDPPPLRQAAISASIIAGIALLITTVR